ncbi:A/G-specific adenine glycosylase, partial [Actinotignum sanguinis]|nr:A/G-specific adenine glycosylase [Actinotignum sanguinis]
MLKNLLSWYDGAARPLPWRAPGTSPWAILVCEVMSQQTPVARVAPAWRAWLERWPTPA